MRCGNSNCGRELPEGATLCPHCGTTLSPIPDLNDATLYSLKPEVRLLGQFRLTRKLGSGGMGDVWLARDEKLDDEVALKVLKSNLVGEKRAVEDLKQEVRLTRRLRHPNIVAVHAYHEEGMVHFVSMEYVEGQSLSEAMVSKGKPFTLAEILPWVSQLAQALNYAHQERVLHRDIKPGNILLDRQGNIKLADFGIARIAKDTETRVTGSMSSGTLVYMSPEQLMGNKLDVRADVYSLAATVYDLLTGHPPFYTGEIKDQIKEKPAPRIDGVNNAVNAVLLRSLAKKPEDRADSAIQFFQELSDAQKGVFPKVSKKKKIDDPTPPWPKWLIWILTLFIIGIFAGGGYYLQQDGRINLPLFTTAQTSEKAPPSAPPPAPDYTAAIKEVREKAEAAQKNASAEETRQFAAQELAQAEQLFKEAVTLGISEGAIKKFGEAEAAYNQAVQIAAERKQKKTLEEQQAQGKANVEAAQQSASAAKAKIGENERKYAKSEVDAGDAAWARAIAAGDDYDAAIKAYNEAEQQYSRAVLSAQEGYKASWKARLELAKSTADTARKSAATEDIKKYAAAELGKAEQLYKEAVALGEVEEAIGKYEAVNLAFNNAVTLAAERKKTEGDHDQAKTNMETARTEALAEKNKIGDSERKYAQAELVGGDAAWNKAEVSGTQYKTATALYGEAKGQYLEAQRIAKTAQEEATRKEQEKAFMEAAKEKAGDVKGKVTAEVRGKAKDLAEAGDAAWTKAEAAGEDFAAMAQFYTEAEAKYTEAIAQANTVAPPAPKPTGPPAGTEKTFGNIDMIWCPAGTFKMGNSEKQHEVTLTKGFWIGKYEVTQKQWEDVTGESIRDLRPNDDESFRKLGKGDKYPIYYLSWSDCQRFIQKLNSQGQTGFRLPTEAEWEYACRAGNTGDYCYGSSASNIGAFAWYKGNSESKTHEVGTKRSNDWKIFDMHGNVPEWCEDWFGDYPDGSVEDPKGPSSGGGHVTRGGGYDTEAWNCRSAHRYGSDPNQRKIIGFRLCRDE